MNAAEKGMIEAIVRRENAVPRSIPDGASCPGRRIYDAIAALPVEADPRVAQIAALREALQEASRLIDGRGFSNEARRKFLDPVLVKIDKALAASEPNGEGK